MHNSRRSFLKNSALVTGAILTTGPLAATPVPAWMHEGVGNTLTILHTNDVHSRLEPFPMDGSRNQGLGGVAARAALIEKIRKEAENVLLLDSGDIFQGTAFFNFYKGEPEIKAMSMMGYDAATMGNHDFDAGLENFATQLRHANFPILLCNYDFSNTPMESLHQPYKIFKKGKLKIGVLGVGIEMAGLVPDSLIGNTKYLDPIQKANQTAYKLKKQEGCDLVICLSHLGYKYKDNKVSDVVLATESENIDVILGAHTHTFLDKPDVIKNKIHSEVIVNQVGWAGIVLGRIDIGFGKGRHKTLVHFDTMSIGEKTKQ
jgi:5'-nucleotidase